MTNKIYTFDATNYKNETIDFAKYKGKTLLIVNTASACGFTPQYAGLETLFQAYKDKNFELFSKIEVNGDNAHPLFQHLKAQAPGILGSKGIKWNFTKFLVNKQGEVIKRYSPTTKPADIANDVAAIL